MDEEDFREQFAQRQQLEMLKKQLFLRVLTREARSRLSNIRMANPDFAAQLEIVLIQLIQSGKYQQIDEQTLVSLIKRLRGEVSPSHITRR